MFCILLGVFNRYEVIYMYVLYILLVRDIDVSFVSVRGDIDVCFVYCWGV